MGTQSDDFSNSLSESARSVAEAVSSAIDKAGLRGKNSDVPVTNADRMDAPPRALDSRSELGNLAAPPAPPGSNSSPSGRGM